MRVQQIQCIIMGLLVITPFQNCSNPQHDSYTLNSLAGNFSYTADAALETAALLVLQTKCASCHQDSAMGGVSQILDVKRNISLNLIYPGDSSRGRIIGSMVDGSMPTNGPVTATEIQTVRDWINSIQITGELPPVDPNTVLLPEGKTVSSNAVLEADAMNVLNISCAGCHQNAALGGIGSILDTDSLVASGLVKPADSAVGRLIGSILDGSMPATTNDGTVVVSLADQQILRNWINNLQIVDKIPNAPAKPKYQPELAPTYTSIRLNILEPKCVGCHGPSRQANNKRYDTHANAALYLRNDGIPRSMPPTPYPDMTAAENAAISAWLNAGAPNN